MANTVTMLALSPVHVRAEPAGAFLSLAQAPELLRALVKRETRYSVMLLAGDPANLNGGEAWRFRP